MNLLTSSLLIYINLDVILKSHPEIITAVASAAIIIVLRLLLLLEEAKTNKKEAVLSDLFDGLIESFEINDQKSSEQLAKSIIDTYKQNPKSFQTTFLNCDIENQVKLFCAFTCLPEEMENYKVFMTDVFQLVGEKQLDAFLHVLDSIVFIHQLFDLYLKTSQWDTEIKKVVLKIKQKDSVLLKQAFRTFVEYNDPENKLYRLQKQTFEKKTNQY